jgi:DinB superfamily
MAMDFSLELGKEVLRRTPDVLHAMLSGLSDDWVAASDTPDAWSPYQVVGHLTYVEQCDWIDRTLVILEHGTERALEPVDREAGFTRFKDWKLKDLLDRFGSVRTSNLKARSD